MGGKLLKKNIIIAGVPRAGKSTVSNEISKRYGYQHISMDSINAGFERCFPELGINTYADMSSFDILKSISGKIAPFINVMMESGEYDEFGRGMVVDVYQLLPGDYIEHIDKSLADIYYFITSDVTAEERFAILKTHDTEKDYTFYKPVAELKRSCAELVEQSIFIREECVKYGLPFYETARDRESLFERFLGGVLPLGEPPY